MSAAGRPDAESSPGDVAGQLRDADFAHLVADATGDGVAATALLVAALDGETPYQVSIAALPAPAERATDADVTLAVGRPAATADIALGTAGTTASIEAHDVAAEFGAVDGALAIAGAIAGGAARDDRLLALADQYGFERRPGIAIPTAEFADGLAHSTFVHTEFSGAASAVREALESLGVPEVPDAQTRRRVASLVATTVAEGPPSTRASHAVERFLRPLEGGPAATLGGFGDLLDGAARVDPNLAMAVGLGQVDPAEGFGAWRDHASRVHETLREAKTGRYENLFVLRCEGDAPVGSVARLGLAYRSPEPVVLAVADGCAAARTTPDASVDVGRVMRDVTDTAGGEADGTKTRARATFEMEPAEYLLAFREAL